MAWPNGSVTHMVDGSNDMVWVEVVEGSLAAAEAMAWASTDDCGAVVTFCGTVRDHSEGRRDVTKLEYEAYSGVAERRLHDVGEAARARWPEVRRVALLHRVGELGVGDVAVVVVVAAPHRDEAFAAAQYCIDTLKATVPIWKRETWAHGREWALDPHPLTAATATSVDRGSVEQ